MAEIENATVEQKDTVVEEQQPETSPNAGKESFGARFKEWLRKQAVNLKRKPQKIAFLFFIISSVMYLIGLNLVSPGPVVDFSKSESVPIVNYMGLAVFITTLFSILVLVLFMNTFPKRGIAYKKGGKKHSMNYIMLALTFAFVIVMIAMDVIYYIGLTKCIAGNENIFFSTEAQAMAYSKYLSADFNSSSLTEAGTKTYLVPALKITIAHIVFLGISALLLATLPLYKKLIMKINTSKVVESTEIKEVIDTEDE